MNPEIYTRLLKDKGLKVTPQRLAVLDALHHLRNHPTTDLVIEYVRKSYPNIASGTVYKVLDTLVDNQLISRVKTEKDIMRYETRTEKHHHLYCGESDRIEDYMDHDLDQILKSYFRKKEIPGFRVEEIRLQIKGKFSRKKDNDKL